MYPVITLSIYRLKSLFFGCVIVFSSSLHALSPYPDSNSGDLFHGAQSIENPANVSHVIVEGQNAIVSLDGDGLVFVNDPSQVLEVYTETSNLLNLNINSSSSASLETVINKLSQNKYYLRTTVEAGFSATLPLASNTGLELSYRGSDNAYQNIKSLNGFSVNTTAIFAVSSTLSASDFLNLSDSDFALQNLSVKSREAGIGLSHSFVFSDQWKMSLGARLRATELTYSANLIDLREVLKQIADSSSTVLVNQFINDFKGDINRTKTTKYLDGDVGLLISYRQNHLSFWVNNLNEQTLEFPNYVSTCDTVNDCRVSAQYSESEVLRLERRYQLGYTRYARSKWFQFRATGDVVGWHDLGGNINQFVSVAIKLGSRDPKQTKLGHPSPVFQIAHSLNIPTQQAYTSMSFKAWGFSLGLGFTPTIVNFLSSQGEVALEDINKDLLYAQLKLGFDMRF